MKYFIKTNREPLKLKGDVNLILGKLFRMNKCDYCPWYLYPWHEASEHNNKLFHASCLKVIDSGLDVTRVDGNNSHDKTVNLYKTGFLREGAKTARLDIDTPLDTDKISILKIAINAIDVDFERFPALRQSQDITAINRQQKKIAKKQLLRDLSFLSQIS